MAKPTLDDLDRCEHGRHSIDPCLSCPGGQSTGNLFLTPLPYVAPDQPIRIGTDLYGEPITVVTRRPPRRS